jgi:hypothetical protein
VIGGFVRPSLAGCLTVGAVLIAIINPTGFVTTAPAPIQGFIYALFLFAMIGVVVTSLIRPLIAVKRILEKR